MQASGGVGAKEREEGREGKEGKGGQEMDETTDMMVWMRARE